LLSLLAASNANVHPSVEDQIVWSLDSIGTFSVKSVCEKKLVPISTDFPAKEIWKSKAPSKVCFLAWAASKGKVPTEIMLKRRIFSLASRCALCLNEEESIDHLFLHCHWASTLWSLALSLMGVYWLRPSNVKDVLVSWRRRLKKCWVYGIWRLIPLAIWWCTWKERNRRIFEGKALSLQNFKLYFLGLLYSWGHMVNGSINLTFLDFIDKILLESLEA